MKITGKKLLCYYDMAGDLAGQPYIIPSKQAAPHREPFYFRPFRLPRREQPQPPTTATVIYTLPYNCKAL